ncbi:STAS domain-containing protein [Alkalimonas delamerensis]|uniref:STAS domain-containing protein n=1 Tax=Alkalimonas delamerensis TaxID=265981 RepID=A0ABT9GNF0_9GAMM|nr:STAS domain-containing protein [Alkalimonas delamerensis]MDP4528498.1 STAS domain-containing protein [Alkalimonas delamerensis]
MSEHRTIRLPERFDFSYHKNFNAQYEPLLTERGIKSLELDFSQVNYLDSSALGMMVLLAKKMQGVGVGLSITGAHGTAKDIIEMANLHKLYTFK